MSRLLLLAGWLMFFSLFTFSHFGRYLDTVLFDVHQSSSSLLDALVLHYRSFVACTVGRMVSDAYFHGLYITFPFQKHIKNIHHHFYVITLFPLSSSPRPHWLAVWWYSLSHSGRECFLSTIILFDFLSASKLFISMSVCASTDEKDSRFGLKLSRDNGFAQSKRDKWMES